MTATFRQEKTGPTVGAVEPVETKKHIDGELLGTSDSSAHIQVQQDIALWQAGYQAGLQDGLAQGPAHPAVQQSVANFFGDWQGAEAARQQSTQRFTNWYRKERAA